MSTFANFREVYPELNNHSDLLTFALSQPQTSWVVGLNGPIGGSVGSEHEFSPASASLVPSLDGLINFDSAKEYDNGGDLDPLSITSMSILTGNTTSGPLEESNKWLGLPTPFMQDLSATPKPGQSSNDRGPPSSNSFPDLLEQLNETFPSPPSPNKHRVRDLPPSRTDTELQFRTKHSLTDGDMGTNIVGLAFAMETRPKYYNLSILLNLSGFRQRNGKSSLLPELTQDMEQTLIQDAISELLLELEPPANTPDIIQYQMVLSVNEAPESLAIYSAILDAGFKLDETIDLHSKTIQPVQVLTMRATEWERLKQTRRNLSLSPTPSGGATRPRANETGKGKGKEKAGPWTLD